MIDSAAKFIKHGLSLQNNQSPKVVRLVGDVTFDETHQKLKKLCLGFAGTHFVDGEWRATMLPAMDCVCHDETTEAVYLTIQLSAMR